MLHVIGERACWSYFHLLAVVIRAAFILSGSAVGYSWIGCDVALAAHKCCQSPSAGLSLSVFKGLHLPDGTEALREAHLSSTW